MAPFAIRSPARSVTLVVTATALALAVHPAAAAPEPRDGQHDFDFELGRWKMHLRRLKERLHNSHEWVDFSATSVTRPLWNGRSQIEEFEADAPTAGHIEGMTVRLYSTVSHQWSLVWANQKDGHFEVPMIGEFRGDRGEFYAQDTWEGRSILCRFMWSNITPTSAHFEQAFSVDGGKTWEVNWITDQTRIE